jgi:hypothetical protein
VRQFAIGPAHFDGARANSFPSRGNFADALGHFPRAFDHFRERVRPLSGAHSTFSTAPADFCSAARLFLEEPPGFRVV